MATANIVAVVAGAGADRGATVVETVVAETPDVDDDDDDDDDDVM